jgi:cytochrome c oxidase assembly protein subunit 15
MLLTAMFAWIALRDLRGARPAPGWLVALSWATLVLALLQVALGVMTSASHSGLTCTGILDCGPDRLLEGWAAGQFIPWRDSPPSAAVHAAHRIGALAILVMALGMAYGLRRVCRVRAAMLGTAVLMQIAIGVALVTYSLPLPAAVAHNTGAAALLVALVAAHHAVLRSRGGHAELI